MFNLQLMHLIQIENIVCCWDSQHDTAKLPLETVLLYLTFPSYCYTVLERPPGTLLKFLWLNSDISVDDEMK